MVDLFMVIVTVLIVGLFLVNHWLCTRGRSHVHQWQHIGHGPIGRKTRYYYKCQCCKKIKVKDKS